MTRFLWATLLALSAWLSAGGGERRRASPSELAAVALDAPARPAAPSIRDALALLRQLAAPRGDDRRHPRQLGAAPIADAPRRGVAAAPRGAESAATASREPRRVADALAFPYDATAPPPAGRRA